MSTYDFLNYSRYFQVTDFSIINFLKKGYFYLDENLKTFYLWFVDRVYKVAYQWQTVMV